jgi:hypothetical protein
LRRALARKLSGGCVLFVPEFGWDRDQLFLGEADGENFPSGTHSVGGGFELEAVLDEPPTQPGGWDVLLNERTDLIHGRRGRRHAAKMRTSRYAIKSRCVTRWVCQQ